MSFILYIECDCIQIKYNYNYYYMYAYIHASLLNCLVFNVLIGFCYSVTLLGRCSALHCSSCAAQWAYGEPASSCTRSTAMSKSTKLRVAVVAVVETATGGCVCEGLLEYDSSSDTSNKFVLYYCSYITAVLHTSIAVYIIILSFLLLLLLLCCHNKEIIKY